VVYVEPPELPRSLVAEIPPGFVWRTCSCGATAVLEPAGLPAAQRKRCPVCETIRQTVMQGHLVDVEQVGADQALADGLRNGRIVLVVDG